MAGSANNLASLLKDTGRREEAEALHREALATYRDLDDAGPDAHLADVAAAVNNLAHLLSSTGRHKEAKPLYLEALATYEELEAAQPGLYQPGLYAEKIAAIREILDELPTD